MRVVLPDGTLGQTVQQWMAAHGFKPKKRVLLQPRCRTAIGLPGC